MYYTVIKHDGHLRKQGNVENTSHRRVFSTFLECSQMSGVFLYHSAVRLRLLHLLYYEDVIWRKTIKHTFAVFYTVIKDGFLTNQSA